MSNKKKFFVLVLAAVVVALNIYIFSYRTPASGVFGFFVEMKADHEDVIQLYYGENTAFQEANSEKIAYTEVGEYQELEFHITSWAAMVRLDLGTDPGEYEIPTSEPKPVPVSPLWAISPKLTSPFLPRTTPGVAS